MRVLSACPWLGRFVCFWSVLYWRFHCTVIPMYVACPGSPGWKTVEKPAADSQGKT